LMRIGSYKGGGQGACEMLGLDPLELTCEGRAVIGVRREDAELVLEAIKAAPSGEDATVVGEVGSERKGYGDNGGRGCRREKESSMRPRRAHATRSARASYAASPRLPLS